MYKCDEVGMDYFETAKNRYQSVVEIDATPEQVFDCFMDADAWPAWAPPITNVEWTSPKPFEVGTTRTVSMVGGLVGDEVFIAWDYPKRMAFCFTHCSKSLINSFAEDYVVRQATNGKTQVIWTMAMKNQGVANISMILFGPFMGIANQWMLGRFKKYVESNF